MVRLSQDAFLNMLTKFYSTSIETGSVVITFKKYVPKLSEKTGNAQDASAAEHVGESLCLVRAHCKKNRKNKIASTLISSKDHVRFQMQFANILRVHTYALKKKERKKKKKRRKKAKNDQVVVSD